MPRAQLWCIDITGAPTSVTKRIFTVDFDPNQTFEDLVDAITRGLKHGKKIAELEPEVVALDVWKLEPSISRDDPRFNADTSTTYADLKEDVMTITPESGNLGEIYLDLPEDECLHLVISLKGAPEPEGTIEMLCSELFDIKQAEKSGKAQEWSDSLGDTEFEQRPDVIERRRNGEDPLRDIPIAILHPAFDRFLLHMHDSGLDVPPEMYPQAMEFASTCWQVLRQEQMEEKTKKKKMLNAMEMMLGYQLMKRTKEGAAFDGLLLVEDVYPALLFLSEDDIGIHMMEKCQKLYSKCIRLASVRPCLLLCW
ncbi:hypothetical protein L218DRAFT_871636 [Marasmius fiardii PR-910]|nr:hypothetical protein L218DRAFT_871636 [Marasmius fiardii PR-910]